MYLISSTKLNNARAALQRTEPYFFALQAMFKYTVFGEVVEGKDVVDKIQRVETDANARPVGDIRILKATVVEP